MPVDSAPEIYPVNYRTDGRSILFRTDPGSKLHGLERDPTRASRSTGSSRVPHRMERPLKGRAHLLVDADEVHAAARARLEYWSIGTKAHWVRIEPYEVTGRRIMPRGDHPTRGG